MYLCKGNDERIPESNAVDDNESREQWQRDRCTDRKIRSIISKYYETLFIAKYKLAQFLIKDTQGSP